MVVQLKANTKPVNTEENPKVRKPNDVGIMNVNNQDVLITGPCYKGFPTGLWMTTEVHKTEQKTYYNHGDNK